MAIAAAIRNAGARMVDIQSFARLVSASRGLAVVALALPDGTAHASVVNAGVLPHPVTGAPAVAVVSRGQARKLRYLRANPRATIVLRAGWQWSAVEGPVELAGPDDPMPGIDAERLRLLLREIFTASGRFVELYMAAADGTGPRTHEDSAEDDAAMAAQRRTAILLTPARLHGN
jgi:hypothetical protein